MRCRKRVVISSPPAFRRAHYLMAGYFSNHSAQPKFPASAASPSPAPAPSPAGATRPRAPSSRHFSTSLSGSGDDQPRPAHPAPAPAPGAVHPLRNTWVSWFRQQRAPGNKITNYEEGIKRIAAFSSVESFWSLWSHLEPPSALVPTTDLLLFHAGVQRPVWEDPLNLAGGKWIIRLKKGVADRIWEDIVLGVIGDQFRPAGEDGPAHAAGRPWDDDWPEICGVTLSVRASEDILSVWNRTDGDMKLRENIRDLIKDILNLAPATIMEYKSNNDSMQDKSSFRNSAVDRTPLA
ncbi:hypothetical protein HWV62_3226 [Athelia sp. TMB]|nr:hypothetical protein HWV62_3226 [Athelia sp. TMB]